LIALRGFITRPRIKLKMPIFYQNLTQPDVLRSAQLFASRERKPSGNHEFDVLCQDLGIEHRLTPPGPPQTNGMVERFNDRIGDVLQTHRFNWALDTNQTLVRYVELYNQQLPQPALQSRTLSQAMKQW
jgi:transposase InsO family protein